MEEIRNFPKEEIPHFPPTVFAQFATFCRSGNMAIICEFSQ